MPSRPVLTGRPTVLLVPLLGALLVGGCTGPGSADPSPSSPGPVATATDGTAPTTPTTPAPTGEPGLATPESSAGDPATGRVAPTGATQTQAPVPLGRPASTADGFTATVTSSRVVEVTADEPGETAGPGVLVSVSFGNTADSALGLDGVQVTAALPDGTPVPGADSAPSAPATGVLGPGETATGDYAFVLPDDPGSVDPQDPGAASDLLLQITSVSSAQVLQVRT